MPRAFLKTKNRGGNKAFKCVVCGEEIVAGEQYYVWKFFRGAQYTQHASHGAPRRSRLTDSKMGEVYDAVDDFDVSECTETEDIKIALDSVAEAARSVAEQYGESADNIESSWPSGNPTSEACREMQSSLESWADDLESWEPNYDEWDPETHETQEDWLDELRTEAQDLVNEAPEYQG